MHLPPVNDERKLLQKEGKRRADISCDLFSLLSFKFYRDEVMEISSLKCQDDVIAFKLINMMSAACFIHNTVQMSHYMCVSVKSDLLFSRLDLFYMIWLTMYLYFIA